MDVFGRSSRPAGSRIRQPAPASCTQTYALPTLYYTYFFASVKCSNFFDDFFFLMEYNTSIIIYWRSFP